MSIAIVCIAWAIGADESLTGDEIVAAFRQNALRATTLRVTSESVSRRSAAAMASDKVHAKNIRHNIAAHHDAPAVEKADALKRADQLEATFADERLQFSVEDFWTDRQNIQIRRQYMDGMPPPWNKIHPSLKFPQTELTRESLTGDFARTFVASLGPATKGEFRRWDGARAPDGYWTAGVFNSWKSAGLPNLAAPPLFLPTSQMQLPTHPFDLLFQPGANLETVVVEHQKLGDVSTVLVAQHRPREAPSITPGGPSLDWVVRAWIDPERACLPLRVERFLVGCDSDYFRKTFATSSIDPKLFQTVVTQVSIAETTDGVFTPAGMEIEGYIAGPMENPPLNMRPDQYDPPTILGAITKVTLRTEVNKAMPEEMFALSFPEGTVFLNHPTNDIMVTGDREGFAERVVTGALKQRGSMSVSWRYWLAGVFSAGAVLLGCRWLRRRRA